MRRKRVLPGAVLIAPNSTSNGYRGRCRRFWCPAWLLGGDGTDIEDPFSVSTVCTDNGDCRKQVCSQRGLFLENTNFCPKSDITPLRALLRLHGSGLRLTTLPSVINGLSQLRIVSHSGPHAWTWFMLWSVLSFVFLSVCGRTNTKAIIPAELILDMSSTRNFRCGCRLNKISRIRANSERGSKRFCTCWQLPRKTQYHTNLWNDGYLQFQLLRQMLADPSPRLPHTKMRIKPWGISWLTAWWVTMSGSR